MVVVCPNRKVEQSRTEVFERKQSVVNPNANIVLFRERIQPAVKWGKPEPMPMVAEGIVRRNEVGEVGIESCDGESDTDRMSGLLIERNLLLLNLRKRQVGDQQQTTCPDY